MVDSRHSQLGVKSRSFGKPGTELPPEFLDQARANAGYQRGRVSASGGFGIAGRKPIIRAGNRRTFPRSPFRDRETGFWWREWPVIAENPPVDETWLPAFAPSIPNPRAQVLLHGAIEIVEGDGACFGPIPSYNALIAWAAKRRTSDSDLKGSLLAMASLATP